jgi:poly(3-hydroxybutyrate) depolymerase
MFLYHVHDWQQAVITPWRIAAEVTQAALKNPFVPLSYMPAARYLAAGAGMMEHTKWPANKPVFGLKAVKMRGRDIDVNEEITAELPFCRLLHFERTAEDPVIGDQLSHDPRVLVVAPLAGHHATLLRDTVQALLPDHDGYITDWLDAKMVPLIEGEFDLDANIAVIMEFMRLLGPNLHVIAVCQPTVPVLCAAALLAANGDPAQPRSITLMGGPVDPRTAPTLVTEFARTHSLDWYRRTVIHAVPFYYPGAHRLVFPGFLHLQGFMSMHAGRHIGEQFKQFQNMVRGDDEAAEYHHKFYDEYLAVMDVTAPYYLQTVERVFQNYDLPKGTFRWRGQPVDLKAIQRTAMLVVEGEMDDISAPGQTRAALDLCTNLPQPMKQYHLQIGVGHFGVFSGRKWRNSTQPVVREFIRRNNA